MRGSDKVVRKTAIKENLFSLLQNDFHIIIAEQYFDKSIFDQMIVDSMRMVSITVAVEKKFDIESSLSFLENPTINNFLSLIEEGIRVSETENS